jgi:hypothetical protein
MGVRPITVNLCSPHAAPSRLAPIGGYVASRVRAMKYLGSYCCVVCASSLSWARAYSIASA